MRNPSSLRLVLLLSAAAALGGCASVGGWFASDEEGNEPAKLQSYVPGVSIKKLWSAGIGSGQGKGYYYLTPAIDGTAIYAVGNDGTVVALDRRTGRKRWRRNHDMPFSGGVGFGAGLVLLGTADGTVVALDPADGAQRWVAEVNSEVLSPPQANDDTVVVQTYDGRLLGLDAADGSERWAFESILPVLTLRGTSQPLIVDRLVIGGFGNGRVLALDINTGAVRWEARVAIAQGRSEIERIVDIDGAMSVVGSTLYVVSYQGRLAAIDLASGRKLWQEDASSFVGVDEGFNNVYVAQADGTVTAFLRNGQGVRWQQPALAYRHLSSPKTIRGHVAVGDLDGYVHLLSQVDGSIAGRVKVDGDGVRADMLAEDDVLYVFGNSGTLAALRVTAIERK